MKTITQQRTVRFQRRESWIDALFFGRRFRPMNVAGCVLWLDASYASGLFTDSAFASPVFNAGDQVGGWRDKSGLSKDVAQATAGARPSYQPGVINGKPVVRFDGTTDFLNVPAIDLTAAKVVTCFAVFSATAGSDQVLIENTVNYTGATTGWLVLRSLANVLAPAFKNDVGISDFASTPTVTTVPKICTAIMDITAASNETSGRVNQDGSGTRTNNSANGGFFGNNASFIGSRAGTSLFLNGDIAELIVYAGASPLMDFEILGVENYFNAKYACF